MIKHHPSEDMLAEFSAGCLDWAQSLIVSAHVQVCPQCKHSVAELNSLGAAMLSSAPKQKLCNDAFSNLMSKIKQQDSLIPALSAAPAASTVAPQATRDSILEDLPPVINKLLPKDNKVKWRFISPSLRAARLETGQDKYEVGFHRISTGGKSVEHGHKGLEITLVLKGSFSDGDGVYTEGDFLVRQPGEVHRPTASQHEDCLCFTVQSAPVEVTGFMGKLVNPFLGIKPS